MMLTAAMGIACIPRTQEMMEIDVKASAEFETFGSWFIQDIDRIAPGLEEMYDFVLQNFEGEQRVRLREFINRALREASDDELERLWNSVDSDVYFPTPQNLRAMLTGARDRL